MICPECKNEMVDEYNGIGNGKLMEVGNVHDDDSTSTQELPVYFCKLCYLLIIDYDANSVPLQEDGKSESES